MIVINTHLLSEISVLISEYTGLKINEDKEKKLSSLILSRIRELQLSDATSYYQKLTRKNKESENELLRLVCSFINKESHFFRDKGHFEAIKNEILPDLIKEKNSKKELKIWCAGCARGEEAYSVAITLFSILHNFSEWKVTIIGTDLCPDVIEKARAGLYGNMAFRGTDPEIKKKFFLQQLNGEYLIGSFIRQIVKFEQNNLFLDIFPNDHSNLNHMDLIICRNVFIYFQRDAITKVVDKFTHTLNQGGYLLTGHGELLDISPPLLRKEILPGALVYRKTSMNWAH